MSNSFKSVLHFALLVCSLFSEAQSLSQPAFIEYNFSAGKVVKNYPVFPERKLAGVNSFIIGSRLNGIKAWHPYYNFPNASFELAYGSLGNKKVLGNFSALLYRLEFGYKLNDQFYTEITPAFGIAYFNKPFHADKNPENTLIGSAFTFCAAARLNLRYYINPFWSVSAGAGVYHCSNSHYQLPNLGVNLPFASAGLRYHIRPLNLLFGSRSIERDSGYHFQVRFAVGYNEQGASTFPVNGPRYPIYLGAFYVTRYLTPVNKFHLGVEGWYNSGVYDFITSQRYYNDKEHLRSTAWQAVVGNEFLFGHFSMLINGGIYFYNPVYHEKLRRENETNFKKQLKGWITARLGFQYYLKDATIYHKSNFYAGVYIKTNLGQADFLETGIGYAF